MISQSGETADTLAAQREAKAKGSRTLAICNVVGSMITREAAGTIYTHAGPEIGVASTKAFTCQLTALFILAMYLGQANGKPGRGESRCLVQELLHLPGKLETVLSHDADVRRAGHANCTASTDFLFLGRGVHFPIALEGALKLKEISYIHAEGYPAGEMKHGPNALIDEKLPVVVLATHDRSERGKPPALREDALQHSGSEGARRHRAGDRHRGRRQGPQDGRPRDRDPAIVASC